MLVGVQQQGESFWNGETGGAGHFLGKAALGAIRLALPIRVIIVSIHMSPM